MPGRDTFTIELVPEAGNFEAFRRIERSLRNSARFAERIRGAGALSAVGGGTGAGTGFLGQATLLRHLSELPKQTTLLRRIEQALRRDSLAGRSIRQVYNQANPLFGYPGGSQVGRRGYTVGAGRGAGTTYNQGIGAGIGSQIAAVGAYQALFPGGAGAYGGGDAKTRAGRERKINAQRMSYLRQFARIGGPLAGGYTALRAIGGAYSAGGQQEAWETGFRNVGGNLAGLKQVEAFNAVTPFSSQQLNPLMLGLMAALGGDNNRAFGIVQSAATLGALSSLKTGNTRGFDRISYHTQAAASRGLVQTEQWNELAIASGVPLNAIAREYAMSLNKGTPEGREIAAMSDGEWSNWMRKRMEKGLLFGEFEKLLGFAAGKYPQALFQASQAQVGKESTLGSNTFLALAAVGKAFQPVTKSTLDALTDLVKTIPAATQATVGAVRGLGQAWDEIAATPLGRLIGAGVDMIGAGYSWAGQGASALFGAGTDYIGSAWAVGVAPGEFVHRADAVEPTSPRVGDTNRQILTIGGNISVSPSGEIGGSVKAKSGSDEIELLNGR